MKNYFTKNDEMFLDLLLKSADGKATDDEKSMVRAALQGFVNKPKAEMKRIQGLKKQLQGVSVSTDFDVLTTNAFNITVEEDNFDMGWEASFQEVPRDAQNDFWELGTIVNGITFRKMNEGERVEVDTITGSKVNVYVDYYGGALGFTDKAIRFRKMAQMLDAARAFRNKFFANKADNHYLLLATAAALAANIIAYQGAGTMTQVQRDILTINEGAFQLGDRNKDKGYGDTASAPLLLYANPRDRARIEAAFIVTSNYLVTAGAAGDPAVQVTDQPIRRIYTFNANIVSGAPVMVLPGRKIQRNEAMAPTTYTAPTDPLTLNQVQAVWSIYGAAVGDVDQVVRLTLS